MHSLRLILLFGVWFGCTPPISELEDDEDTTVGSGLDDGGGGSGMDCDDGVGIIDCDANCWSSSVLSMLGDGVCDEGERGPDFSCADWSDDEGDCTPGGGGSDVAGDADTSGGEDTSGEDGGMASGAADSTGGSEDAGSDDGTGGSADDGGSAGTGDTSGSDDGSGADGGSSPGTYGGCEFSDGECVNGLAAGECTAFGGTWYSDGCPAECYDSYVVDGYYYDSDPSDVVYDNTFEPSCRSSSGATDVAYAWSPSFDGEYCFTVLVGAEYEDMGIAPVLSIWDDDCFTELDCVLGDPSESAAMVFHTDVFLASKTYRVVLEHYRITDVGEFSLIIDPCPVWTK